MFTTVRHAALGRAVPNGSGLSAHSGFCPCAVLPARRDAPLSARVPGQSEGHVTVPATGARHAV